MAKNVTDQDFKSEVLDSDLPVLVDFWAPWCGPCKMVAPIVEEISKDYEGKLEVCKINLDESREIAGKYQVMIIPTLAIFKNGQLEDKLVGAVSKGQLEEKINPYL